jgi:hypothetical protein
VVAHELVHVFALGHEFQRPDRDQHVSYKCENLIGYAEAMKKAQADGKTNEDLCTKPKVMVDYDFPWDCVFGRRIVRDFDTHSITNYPSLVGTNPDIVNKDPKDPENYPWRCRIHSKIPSLG